MNYDHLKQKMDEFFDNTTPEELRKKFEEMGYEFEDITKLDITKSKNTKRGGCTTCRMIAAGVKFRKSPSHTCINNIKNILKKPDNGNFKRRTRK